MIAPVGQSLVAGAHTDYSRLYGTIFLSPGDMRILEATVVGAGALGNEVCRILGLLGVAKVLIVDPDRVEPSNLTRSVLFRLKNFTGRNKAEALAEASTTVFPDTKWNYLPVAMADAGLLRLSGSDLIFSCVDSDLARIEIVVSALKARKPVVDGGLGQDGDTVGRVARLCGRRARLLRLPTHAAVFRAQLLAEHFQRRYSCTAASVAPASSVPATPALAAIVGSLQVDRAVRHLATPLADRTSRSLELRLDGMAELRPLRVNRDPSCPFHHLAGVQVPVPSADMTFAAILESAGLMHGAVILDWPVCALARCRACGGSWAPLRRLGLVRGGPGCPKCGVQDWVALETVSEVGVGSRYAREPVSIFGLPGEHVLSCLGGADRRA